MREAMHIHIHVLFSFSFVLLWLNITTATSFGYQQLVATTGGGAASMCIDKERHALLDFKAHLQDPGGRLSTWTSDEEDDCCQWSGVTCDTQTGHVTDLILHEYRLVGEISFSLLNLSYLNHLDLSYNSFHGNILESIGSMTHLTYLHLSRNEFTGTIFDSVGNMTQLTYLDLSLNNFSGTISKSVGSFTQLTDLNLGGNQLTGTIPRSIGSLTNLTHLDLHGNNFTGTIPESIGSLTNLTWLDLSENSFYGTIPTEFGNLTNLLHVNLDSLGSCRVENLDWLSSLSKLDYLTMDGTSLAKASNWVNVIIGLQNLEILSLGGCDLSHVTHPYSPSDNSSLSLDYLYLRNNNLNSSMYRWLFPLFGKRLAFLHLSGNKFDGELSDFLNSLSGCISSTLQNLDASSNQFTGLLSDEIQHFSTLFQLNLSSNQLDGTVSDKVWQLPSLQELDLSSNSLRGDIYVNMGKSNLVYIDLSHNSLEGGLSDDDVSNLSQSILYIDFSSNKLGPRFPKWIQELKNLTHLDLSKNSISDTVSTKYRNLLESSMLGYLDLSFNNIRGRLPENVDFSFLDLSRNKFHGGISFLCQMSQRLEFLDLSRNLLTGQLPDCFQNLTNLNVLNLGYNTLSGSIPPSIGCLGQLETLSIYNNSFSGELPHFLKNCTMLSLLDLGVNKLYGNIPVWIGKNLSMLFALSLKSNNFFGTIPSQICQLVNLQIIDLSFNNLHGTIPSCVNNLTSMVQKQSFFHQNVHRYHSFFDLIAFDHGDTYSTDFYNTYIDRLMIQWQGKINEFSSNLGFVKNIDLSSNGLTGQIPYEITDLQGLVVLNLSHNTLRGEIPKDIGQMKELLTLDLSKNNLSGGLPSSMSEMNFLNDLDVSYNNLSGRVPSSTQLQSCPAGRFTGNTGLCGLPTSKICPEDEDLDVPTVNESENDAESIPELQKWFYIGGATGFVTAFWIACSTLVLNRRLRHAFFLFHNRLKDWVYVTVAIFIAKFQRAASA